MPNRLNDYVDRIKTSEKNKEILKKYIKYDMLRSISKLRIVKKLGVLKHFILKMKKEFRAVTKKDLEEWFLKLIHKEDYAEWTKRDHMQIVKSFYKWLEGKEGNTPRKVAWIKLIGVRSKINPSDILTDEEFERFLKACNNPRDRAFFKFMKESGARIGEALSMRIKDVDFQADETTVRLPQGKTGPRTIMIIASIPFLKRWLDYHPDKDNLEAKLWTKLDSAKPWSRGAIRNAIFKIKRRAGLKKRIYPHLFRHTCASELARKGWSEREMELYLGWVHGSNMPQTYIHLTGRDLDKKIRQRYGLSIKDEDNKPELIRCPNCGTINDASNQNCSNCHLTLNLREAQKRLQKAMQEEKKNKALELMIENHPEMIEMLKKIEKLMEKETKN